MSNARGGMRLGLRLAGLSAVLAGWMVLPGCTDNPEGNPPRESISAPRDKIDGGAAAPSEGEIGGGGGAAPAGKTDRARNISL